MVTLPGFAHLPKPPQQSATIAQAAPTRPAEKPRCDPLRPRTEAPMHPAAPNLSVVVPCYNEEPVLDALHARLSRVCDGLGTDYEIVLVNDGSKDDTWGRMA